MSCEENFKLQFALTVKKKNHSLPQFKWNNIGEQDLIGKGSFGAGFVTRYTKNEDCSDSSSVEPVEVKTLLRGNKIISPANVVDS